MARPDEVKFSLVDVGFWVFAFSVAFLPIGLGGDRPIPVGIFQAGLALSGILLLTDRPIWDELRFPGRIKWALGLLVLVLLWGVMQTLPIFAVEWQHPIWQEASSVLNHPIHGAISIVPEDALKGLARLFTYIAAGFLAYIFAQTPVRARQLIYVLWYSGAAIAAYGTFLYGAGLHTILWFDKWAYEDDLTATFVNHNHYAIYAGLVLICGASILLRSFVNDVQKKKDHHRVEAIRAWLVLYGLPHGFLFLLVLISIVLTHSRAGLIMTLIGLGSFLFLYQIYLKAWGRAAAMVFLTIIILAVVFVAAVHTSTRFAVLFHDYSSLDRLYVYRLGLHALKDNPFLGYGLNGFEPEFRLYQQNMIMEFNHAHNDVLESLIDLGLPVGLMLWVAIGLLLTGVMHGVLTRRQDGMFPAIGLAASITVLGHACVDFSLQIPGVAVVWATLLGAGLAQSWGRSHRHHRRSDQRGG